MARRNNKKSTRRPRSRAVSQRGLVLGGPNSTYQPIVTLRQTSTFDLGGTTFIAFNGTEIPLKTWVYAIPPRDTDAGTPTSHLASINVIINGVRFPSTAPIEIQTNTTILPYNGQRKLCAVVDFRRMYTAGLQLPTTSISTTLYHTPITLELSDDLFATWGGPDISIFVVTEFAYEFNPPNLIFSIDADTPTSAVQGRVIDNDIKKSNIIANNTVGAYRLRAERQIAIKKTAALLPTVEPVDE